MCREARTPAYSSEPRESRKILPASQPNSLRRREMIPVTTQQVNRQTALDSSATTAKKMKSCMGNNSSLAPFFSFACYMQQPTFIQLLSLLNMIRKANLFPSRSSEPFQHGSSDGQGKLYYTGANCARDRPHGPYAGSARSRLAAKDLAKEMISRPVSSLKKTPYRSKVQNVYIQEDTLTGGYRYSRGVEHLHIAE